jgi:hypothetical protein
MARWQDNYRKGDRVEVRFRLGETWHSGVIVRTYRSSGNPVVSLDGSQKWDWVVARKDEIRKTGDD